MCAWTSLSQTLTGYAAESAAESLIWDSIVRGTDKTPAELITARQQYCRQPQARRDPICGLWNPPNLAQADDIDPILRDTTPNERLAWIGRECADHPLERIKDAVERMYLELAASKRDASPGPAVFVGTAHYRTNVADTTVLLTMTTQILTTGRIHRATELDRLSPLPTYVHAAEPQLIREP